MAKSSKYWQARFDQIEQAANDKSVKHVRQIDKKYDKAMAEIDTKINAWYQRVADNNQVSMTEARKLLSAGELKELKWNLDDYIKAGEENAIDQRWMKELENASAKFHINRLEALKLETRQSIENVFGGGQESMYDTLSGIYKDSFYHSCFELQKGIGVGFNVAKINDKKLALSISKPWAVDGTNFSDKLWTNKTKLINTLDQELSRMVITGDSPDKAIKNIAKAMNTSKSNAARLVMTEQAYFTTQAQKDSYAELGVEEYEIVATLDGTTCDDCGGQDSQHYPIKDMQVGVNAPPFHPNCRCTTCPYFDDEFTQGERVVRNAEGDTYMVPENMSYKEWKNQYVQDSVSQKMEKSYNQYKSILHDNTPSIEEFTKISYNEDEKRMFKAYTSSVKSGELTPLADFNLYKNISNEMNEKLIGITTSTNVNITGKSNHSIARMIGSVEQKRNGVQVSDVYDALISEDSEILPIKNLKNGKSQKFRTDKVEVSINPDTGNIIQVNPVHRKKVNS